MKTVEFIFEHPFGRNLKRKHDIRKFRRVKFGAYGATRGIRAFERRLFFHGSQMQPVAKRLEEIRTRNGANRQRVDSARSSAKNRARRNVEVFEFKPRNLIDKKGRKNRERWNGRSRRE